MATFTYLKTVSLTGCITTQGSANLTVAASATGSWGIVIGTVLSHPNLPVGTTIIGFNSSTEVVMSENALVTGASLVITATNPNTINMSDISTVLKTGNDVYNISGPTLFVDSHSRYGLNQNTSTVIRTMTLSATYGGNVEYNSTKVRLIAYDSGSSNVPVLDTEITQGSASGKLLGVYSALNVSPTASGSPMPASGYILIRQWNSVSYSAGALSGISASATQADRAGWLEIVGVDNAYAITVNRLNQFKALGSYWDFLGVTTDGSRTTGYQIPTNGGSMWVPGVEVSTTSPQSATYTWINNVVTVTLADHGLEVDDRVEINFTSGDGTPNGEYSVIAVPTSGTFTFTLTGSGTAGNCTVTEYEFYPNAGSQTATIAKIATDALRGRWCWIVPTTGLVYFGYDGTNSTGGYCPPAGRKIRTPNLFFQNCLSTDLTVNTIPHATIATRMEFATTGGGDIVMHTVNMNWYMNFSQAFSVSLNNTFTFDALILSENASEIDWYNVGVGQSAAISLMSLTMTYNFSGGSLNKCVFTRSIMSSSGNYTISLTDIIDFTFQNIRLHQMYGVRGHVSTGSATLTRITDCTWENTVIGGGQFLLTTCADVTITDSIYYDLPTGTTVATIPHYTYSITTNCLRIKMDGLTFGGLTMCQPYSGILTIAAASSYITLRNIGTYDNPLDLGDTRQDDVSWSRSGTVATVTKASHGLKTGDRVYVVISSSTGAITVALKTLTGTPTEDTFTFTCANAGDTSGTLSYFPTMSAYLFIVATGCTNILIQRCFVPHTATNLFTADNTVKNLRIDNVISDYLNPFLTAANNLTIRSVSGSPTLVAQTAVYGTHRLDAFNADVTTNLTNLSWSRTTTVCTVTCANHNLRTGLFINVNVSSDKTAVPLGIKSVTVINSSTFTFTCVNTGDASGTLNMRTVVDRVCLLMNEANEDTADQIIDKTGTANFTSAGGLVLPTLGDSVTFDSPTYRYGHTGFPIQEVVMNNVITTATIIPNFNIWYSIDKNDGNGYSDFKNLYYTRYVVPLTINAAATTYTNIVKLTSSKFLVVYGRATFLSACIVNIIDGNLEPGIEYIFNAIATTYISVTRMSETQAIAAFVTGTYLQVCTLNIVGDVVTLGPNLTVNSAATTYVAVCRLTDTQAIVVYSEATLGKACTLNISGTTITNGTPLALESVAATTYNSITRMTDTQAIVVQESTLNDANCFTLNVSGTDLSYGATIIPVAGTVTYCAVTAVSSTMAVMCCVNATYIWACTLSVSGTDLTAGTVIQVTSATSSYTALEMISSTQVLLSYTASTTFLCACTLNISGTDLTAGAEKAVNSSVATYSSMSLVSSSQAIIAYAGIGTYLQVRRLDIDGTDVDCKSDGVPGGYTFSIANDSSGVAVGDYVWTGTNAVPPTSTTTGGNAKITDITNGVITVDEPHTGVLSGILRFNHIRNESVTALGFKLKIKIASIVNNYTTPITSLSIYTDSDDTSRAVLYPLDDYTVTFTGLQVGTKIAIREAGTENLLEILTAVGGSATYSYHESELNTEVDLVILAPGYLLQRILNYTLPGGDISIPVAQNIDYGYDSEADETVTFDGPNKRIICDVGTRSISVVGVYSMWVDWALTGDNLQYLSAFSELGGNDIDADAGTSVPVYAFLLNNWKISPDEASHTLSVTDGIILVDGGGDPFADTVGAYVVRINYQQPVQAITVSSGSGLSEAENEQLMKTLTVNKFLGLK